MVQELTLAQVRTVVIAFALAFGIAFAASAALAAPASAQGQPAICEQYPNLPECQAEAPAGGGGERDDDDGGEEDLAPIAGAGGPTAAAGDGGAAGKLPFTGYPLTGLLLLLLILLVVGLTIRAYLAMRKRLADDTHAT